MGLRAFYGDQAAVAAGGGRGGGQAEDRSAAATWFRKAALQGHTEAQTALGVLLAGGTGVARDDKAAVAWFGAAADAGDAEAQWLLGQMYYERRGVGAPAADAATGPLHHPDSDSHSQRAASLFRAAAEQGHPRAQFSLGVCHEYGRGLPQDFGAAAKLYGSAAELGNKEAQYFLGLMLAYGRGVGQDLTRAAMLFKQSATAGHAPAQFYMGRLYLHGQGVPVDYKLALLYLTKAANSDDPIAAEAPKAKREIQLLVDKVEKKQTKEGTELFERNMNMPSGSLRTNTTFDSLKKTVHRGVEDKKGGRDEL